MTRFASEIRKSNLWPCELRVTASLGVSSFAQKADSPQDLLDQADKCLYVAKRNGRNQVIRFDKAQKQISQLGETPATARKEPCKHAAVTIPFQAVTALWSAMSYRDQPTAAHSRRVADLCVATAEGLLSMRERYNLEIAALMHDIGVQIERLVAALDDQDLGELRTLTSRILTTAERAGIDSMVDVSEQLLESLEHDKDMIGIMQAANELLDLCRLTQFSLIQGETQRLVTA